MKQFEGRLQGLSRLVLCTTVVLATLSAQAGHKNGHDRGRGQHDRCKGNFTLTILHNNDGESQLLPMGDEGGVARFANVVHRAKFKALLPERGGRRHHDKNDRGVIFVSSGDNFLAGPAFTASLADGVFYDALALDMLGYDAIDLGNHDFDFGPDVLAQFISEGFKRPGYPPYLSANLDFSNEPALQALFADGTIAASTIVYEKGRRIGIVGATTPNLSFISSPRDVIVIEDVAAEVQAEVDALTAEGVKYIVFISHLQGIADDLAVISQLSGVDVSVAGGGDELLANSDDLLLPSDDPNEIFGAYPLIAIDADGNEVPVVTTSGQYGYLGRLVVEFDRDGDVVSAEGGPIRVIDKAVADDGVRANRRMQRKVVDPVEAFVADLALNVIGNSDVALNGVRGDVRSRETNEGNLIADSQLWQANQLAVGFGIAPADVALQNGGGIRNDSLIPSGDITELDTFDMVPFGNFVAIVEDVDRTVFVDLMENAVSRIDANGDAVGSGTGRFAQIAGFSFTYDSSIPAGARISDMTLDDGTPIVVAGVIQPGDAINVAIVDFLARGGDEYDFGGASFTTLGISYQQALYNYIVAPAAEGGLDGQITAADYPEGGEGRIIRQ